MAYVPTNTSSLNYLTVPVVATTASWQMSVWVKNSAATHYIAYITGTPSISVIISGGKIQVGASGAYAEATLTVNSGWFHLLITSSAGVVTISQDAVALTVTGTIDAASIWTGSVIMMRGGATVADVRIIDTSLSAATWAYYRADVIAGGDKCLPA